MILFGMFVGGDEVAGVTGLSHFCHLQRHTRTPRRLQNLSRSFLAGSGEPKLGGFLLRAVFSTPVDFTLTLGSLLSSPHYFLSTYNCVKGQSRAAERRPVL